MAVTIPTTSEEMRFLAVKLMKSRMRKNAYTNGNDRVYFFGKPHNDPGNTTEKGYSDCSRAVQKSILAASGINIGHNTHYQILNQAKGIIVDTTTGIYPDESKLLPGDCLYFKGNKYHVEDVGHVEMYTGPNECYGHGSGTGPTKKNLRSYCAGRSASSKRYYKAIRWIPNDGLLPDLSEGDKNPYVTMMQTLLLSKGYTLPNYGADGSFGQETKMAVLAFRLDNDLPIKAVCDSAMWDILNGTAPIEPEEPAAETNPYKAPVIDDKHMVSFGAGVGVKGGNEGVKHIQWELIDAGFSCGTAGIDGEFGKKTLDAVVAFQRKAFQNKRDEWDGVVGPTTYGKLIEIKGTKWLDTEE